MASKVRSCFNASCRPWRDTNGKRIEAHGGILLERGGLWWWFGETAKLETGYLKCQPWCASIRWPRVSRHGRHDELKQERTLEGPAAPVALSAKACIAISGRRRVSAQR